MLVLVLDSNSALKIRFHTKIMINMNMNMGIFDKLRIANTLYLNWFCEGLYLLYGKIQSVWSKQILLVIAEINTAQDVLFNGFDDSSFWNEPSRTDSKAS